MSKKNSLGSRLFMGLVFFFLYAPILLLKLHCDIRIIARICANYAGTGAPSTTADTELSPKVR